jgi:hypothetical protein
MGRAVTDAALGLVGNSLSKVGAGIFAVSAFALDQVVSSARSKNGTMEV